MKSIVAFSILVFAFLSGVEAQTDKNLRCPVISITHPSKITMPGETMIFSAKLENFDSEKLIFNWTTSGGDIVEGQGTPIIKILATPETGGQYIGVTVEVKGLPENCVNTFSERTEIGLGNADPIALDEYKNISLKDVKIRLSAIAYALRKEKNDTAYFIVYLTAKEKLETAKLRSAKIARYLVETYKVPKDRFVFIYSKSDFHRTIIYLVPADVSPPNPN